MGIAWGDVTRVVKYGGTFAGKKRVMKGDSWNLVFKKKKSR